MKIAKELMEKLMKADSLEAFKALLDGKVTEEEVLKLWKQIRTQKKAEDSDAAELADDALGAVVGGIMSRRQPDDGVLPIKPGTQKSDK